MRRVRKEMKSVWDLADDIIRGQIYPNVIDYVITEVKWEVNRVWTRVRILIDKELRSS